MATQLNLLVIRAVDPQRTRAFYEALGLLFTEEHHGSGPVHWAASFDNIVFEIYPSQTQEPTESIRLGFVVDDLQVISERMREQGAEVISPVRLTEWGLRLVVRDPDGRAVEIVARDSLLSFRRPSSDSP